MRRPPTVLHVQDAAVVPGRVGAVLPSQPPRHHAPHLPLPLRRLRPHLHLRVLLLALLRRPDHGGAAEEGPVLRHRAVRHRHGGRPTLHPLPGGRAHRSQTPHARVSIEKKTIATYRATKIGVLTFGLVF